MNKEDKKQLLKELQNIKDKFRELGISYPEYKKELVNLLEETRKLAGLVYRNGKPFVGLTLP